MIHSRAIVDPKARIADNVEIGPWCVIGPDVEIGEGSWIGPHVVIKSDTTIGTHNKIFQFASVGEDPQDKKYHGEKTFLKIGDHNIIREYVTINRGTAQANGATRIGNHNLFMACVHVAHDCDIANNTIFANNAGLAGHVTVRDYAIFGGFCGVHQFCHIGAHSFIGGGSMITKDVLPYILVDGHEARARGLNTEGLKRRGFSSEALGALRQAYKVIYRSKFTVAQAIENLTEMSVQFPEVAAMMCALKESTRGIVR